MTSYNPHSKNKVCGSSWTIQILSPLREPYRIFFHHYIYIFCRLLDLKAFLKILEPFFDTFPYDYKVKSIKNIPTIWAKTNKAIEKCWSIYHGTKFLFAPYSFIHAQMLSLSRSLLTWGIMNWWNRDPRSKSILFFIKSLILPNYLWHHLILTCYPVLLHG